MKPTKPLSLLTHSIQENGYHPTSTTRLILNEPEPLTNCSLHLYFALPPLIFVDPYELAHHEASYTFRHWGPSNLELPVGAIPQNDSHVLLNVARTDNSREFEVKLPLHLRYGNPSKIPYHTEHFAWPNGFFQCPHNDAPSILSSGPPSLPNETLAVLDLASKFVQIAHYGAGSPDLVRVPTGAPSDLAVVQFGTIAAILLTFLFLVRTSRLAYQRINRPHSDKKE